MNWTPRKKRNLVALSVPYKLNPWSTCIMYFLNITLCSIHFIQMFFSIFICFFEHHMGSLALGAKYWKQIPNSVAANFARASNLVFINSPFIWNQLWLNSVNFLASNAVQYFKSARTISHFPVMWIGTYLMFGILPMQYFLTDYINTVVAIWFVVIWYCNLIYLLNICVKMFEYMPK